MCILLPIALVYPFEPAAAIGGEFAEPPRLLARLFSYANAHRARLGVNYKQIPVNRPEVPMHSYSKDGMMRVNSSFQFGVAVGS